MFFEVHPSNCHQDSAVRVHHDQERQHQAEDEEAQHIRDAGWRTEVPLDRARGPGSFGPVAAPAQQGGRGPEEGVDPGASHTKPGLPEVGDVDLRGLQHGGATLIGEDGQGDQGHDS